MALDLIETRGGITRIKAKSTDVVRVNYSDINKEIMYVANEYLGTWNIDNPTEDTQIVTYEDITTEDANNDMNKVFGTTGVVYFK